MIAIFDFAPRFCANCGKPTNLLGRDEALRIRLDADYRAGASYQCDCGLMYQIANRKDILNAADAFKGGDLKKYA